MKHLTNQKTFGNLCLLLLLWVFSTSSVLLPKNKNAYGVSFFTGTLQSALIVTQSRDLPLFVLLYEPYTLSDMESTVFNQKDVELFYNSHFFNCKIKSDSEDGKYLIEKYNIPICRLCFSLTVADIYCYKMPVKKLRQHY